MKANEKEKESRAVRIAERLATETLRTAYVPDEQDAPGAKALAGVTTVEIRVVFPVAGKRVAITRRMKRQIRNFDATKPYYPLEMVKRLAGAKPPRVSFSRLRTDGKADPRNIAPVFTEEKAIAVIAALTPQEFRESKPRFGPSSHAVDVYITKNAIPPSDRRLYIKFYVDGNALVCVESFHKSEF